MEQLGGSTERRILMVGLTALVGLSTYNYVRRKFFGYNKLVKNDKAKYPSRAEMQMEDLNISGKSLEAHLIPRLAKRMATLARTELYLTAYTEDQVIQVREWITRKLKEMDVRLVDIAEILPYAERLAFLQTRAERAAIEMTLSEEFIQRRDIQQTQIWTYELPSHRYWTGRFISEKVPLVR